MSHLMLVSVHILTLKHLFYTLILTRFLPKTRYLKPGNIWLVATQIFTPAELFVSCDNLDVGSRQRRNFQKLSVGKKPQELEFYLYTFSRSSHWICSVKKGVLKIFAIFTGKHLCWSLFFIMMHAFRLATFLQRDFSTGVFCEYYIIFKDTYFKEHL